MKNLNFILACCTLMLMAFALTQSRTSNAQGQTVISLSDTEVFAGETAVIEAEIDCSLVWCGDIALTVDFDPTYLQVDSLEVGPYLGEQHLEITSIDNNLGQVSFRVTGFQGDSSSADNVLFRLNVRPVEIGQTIIEVNNIEVKDRDENFAEAVSVSGIVDIQVDLDNLLTVLSSYDWQIAFVSERDGNPEIYIMNPDGSNQTRITEDDARDDMPAWSPTGSQIAFVSERDGNPEIYVMNPDGSNPKRLTEDDAVDDMPTWSPDGSQIAFVSERDGNRSIFVMDVDGRNQRAITDNVSLDEMPTWSPDGLQIAFISERDGQRALYVYQIESREIIRLEALTEGIDSTNTWSYPVWSPDGTVIAVTSEVGDTVQLRAVDAADATDSYLFDQDVRRDHLAWSRDANWLVYGSTTDGASNVSILFIDEEATENLTDDTANDYAPDLFDPLFCAVRTDSEVIRVRVGPGFDRGIFGYFPANQDVRIIGQTTASDGSLWWEIDTTFIEGGENANSLWVAQDTVVANRRCVRVVATDAPPIVAVQPGNNTLLDGQWGFCGSCNSCGPHPSNECVTSPDGVCLWDPTTCRNVTVVTVPVDPGSTPPPPGADPCFIVSMNFRSTDGSSVSPAPSQIVNTASNCSTGSGFTAGTSVSISTTGQMCTGGCGPSSSNGFAFDHWEGTCSVAGGSSASFTINNNCIATAVYRPVVIIG